MKDTPFWSIHFIEENGNTNVPKNFSFTVQVQKTERTFLIFFLQILKALEKSEAFHSN